MRTVTKYYGMAHICRWDREDLDYDGLCSHYCLNEGIPRDYELSAEQLEALSVEKNKKRKADQREISSNWHYQQMETDYDEYRDNKNEKKRNGSPPRTQWSFGKRKMHAPQIISKTRPTIANSVRCLLPRVTP